MDVMFTNVVLITAGIVMLMLYPFLQVLPEVL